MTRLLSGDTASTVPVTPVFCVTVLVAVFSVIRPALLPRYPVVPCGLNRNELGMEGRVIAVPAGVGAGIDRHQGGGCRFR